MEKNRTISLPENAKRIIETLEQAGYEAYAVGGCVRDSLIGRDPQDWDITTSARPEQVKALFHRTVDTGLQHGTVTVMLQKEGFEVTTFRLDGVYEDGRHPKEVTFTPSLEEDLKRRDFTINAMAYNESRGLVDLFGGLEDLERKVLRCVGDPMERFGEDALRMLRAVRFSAQLGLSIDPETLGGIRKLAGTLSKISAERIQTELTKLLLSDHPEYLRTAWETGLTAVFFPEFDKAMRTPQNHPHHCYNVGEHILRTLTGVPAQKDLRLTMLLHDIAKPETMTVDPDGTTHFKGHAALGEKMSREILRRWKYDNHTIDHVSHLVRIHDYGMYLEPDEVRARRALMRMGAEDVDNYLLIRRADVLAQSEYLREEKFANIQAWKEALRGVLEREECYSLKDLAVNGSDLIREGFRPGPGIGEVLQSLLETVIEAPEKNTKDTLLEEAKAWKACKEEATS